MEKLDWGKGSLLGATMAAIVASLCCVGPLVLLLLGIGGAWVSTLTQLAFLGPVGIILTLFFLIMVFLKLYITPKRCAIEKPCANPKTLRTQRIVFWLITIILLTLLTFPWYAFLFY